MSVGSVSAPTSGSWVSPTFVLKPVLLLLAKCSGLFALSRVVTSRKTRILAYHGIWLGEGHFGNFLYMSPQKFAARMALLEKWRYPVVAFTDKPAGKHCPTVITIDDGWYGTWSAMLPILEAHRYPATVYLATYYCLNQAPVLDVAMSYCFAMVDTNAVKQLHLPAYGYGPVRTDTEAARRQALDLALSVSAALDDDSARQKFLEALCASIGVDHARLTADRWFNLMNPEEVKDAASRGLSFEAHTHHHRITHQGKDCLAEEIAANIEHIVTLSGRIPEHFCYPSGRYSSELWPVLESCHMVSATTTDIGLVDAETPRFAMPRILDGQNVSELEFEAEMSGFMELWRIMARAVKGRKWDLKQG